MDIRANKKFTDACAQLIAVQEKGGMSIAALGEKILQIPLPDVRVHPMIVQIRWLADDLADEWREKLRSEEETYQSLKQTLESFAAGRWQPTVWTLLATYTVRKNESVSVAVRRRHGSAEVLSPHKTLRSAIVELGQTLERLQTDERWLQNLAACLPQTIDSLTFMDVTVSEMLDS